ncbi:MAG: hypothetical protein JXA33_24230 [Anaerolineae bacterium]|nr:hypothetical protein [Anaerolineae bacterium]
MNSTVMPQEIQPQSKPFKRWVIRGAMFAIGRAWQALYRFDRDLQQEIAEWPARYKVMFKVRPNGPYTVMEKDAYGQLCYAGQRYSEDEVNLIIFFKNVESGFLAYTAQIGMVQAYTEHRISIKGDLYYSMSVARSINIVETYLFPASIARHTVKRPPEIPPLKKHAYRLWTVIVGIPFGV